MKERIIQFGEGNFLRGFVDSFVEEMNRKSLFDGQVAVVIPTPRGRKEKFIQQDNAYHLLLRGMQNNEVISDCRAIHSISRVIQPYEEFDEYLSLARQPEMRFIISNTTEAGIVFDESNCFSDRPAASYPGKLTQLLYERFCAGLDGFIILPCELIDRNADLLNAYVLRYAELWQLGDAFIQWIQEKNQFCNTLVDRIVTGYPAEEADTICRELGAEDLLLDTAEPYHIWVIEGDYEHEFPLRTAGINAVWTKDVTPYKKQKVRILNGAHTLMTFPALLCGIETVKECLDDDQIRAFLMHTLQHDIVPFVGTDTAVAFADAVLERFQNPFIHHRLTSIALNSVSKFSARVLPSALDNLMQYGCVPKSFSVSMAALLWYYQHETPNDIPEAVEYIRTHSVQDIVENQTLWGAELTAMSADVCFAYDLMKTKGIREALQWAMS